MGVRSAWFVAACIAGMMLGGVALYYKAAAAEEGRDAAEARVEAQQADLITLAERLDDQVAETARRDALLVAARAERERITADLTQTQRRLAHAWVADDCAGRALPADALCVLAPAHPNCGGRP